MIDEKTCPHCGHGVLSWEIVCPGCGMFPRETPEGQSALRLWRLRNLLYDEWQTIAALLFVCILSILWFLPGGKRRHHARAVVAQAASAPGPTLPQEAPASDSVIASKRLDATGTTADLYASGKVVIKGLLPPSYGSEGLSFPDLDSVEPTIEAMRNTPRAPMALERGPAVDWLLKTAIPELKAESKKSR
jgi:hypothetical protein